MPLKTKYARFWNFIVQREQCSSLLSSSTSAEYNPGPKIFNLIFFSMFVCFVGVFNINYPFQNIFNYYKIFLNTELTY